MVPALDFLYLGGIYCNFLPAPRALHYFTGISDFALKFSSAIIIIAVALLFNSVSGVSKLFFL
ncbi:hypothetical protein B0H16DRAFT_1586404 [Mycena metata]|uniref:Uncharacterized protein n=1 Tax=Mycena metata TaxID=1033252 RepID=A0AAD7MTB8_9AGAR|nr:hypothetical protein B0H16DRAFT_1586404 [Mycena metata]